MIAENFLKELNFKAKKFKKESKEILDIVLYGSVAKGKRKPSDLDIIFIFNNLELTERVNITQKFKKELKHDKIDLKSINIKEFLDKTFLARQGIISEGISLLDNKPFSEKFGFKGFEIFCYELKNLSPNEKTLFTFSLNGRRGQEGILKKTNSKRLGSGAILVPSKDSELFREFLESWKLNFKSNSVLIPKYE